MTVIRVLRHDEAHVLDNADPDVFDHAIDPRWCAEFFADPPHHLAVAETHHGQGIDRRLLAALFEHGAALGCHEAWVLTSPENTPAVRMYTAAGGIIGDEPTVMFTFPLRTRDG